MKRGINRTSKSYVQSAHDKLLMRAFRNLTEETIMLEDTIRREDRLIFLDMIRDGLIEETTHGYQITQRGIAAWWRVVDSWWGACANTRIARAVLDHYYPDGSPKQVQAIP